MPGWDTIMAKPCAEESDKKHDKLKPESHQDIGRDECVFW